MLGLDGTNGHKARCFFTATRLPPYINHDQPPTKKAPISTILKHTLSHTLDVVLPRDAAQPLEKHLTERKRDTLSFAKVFMKPGDLLQGDFFNEYIKKGNIIMISEGRQGIDHTFTLQEGILRIEVDRPTFERLGLDGKPISPGPQGRKHSRARYLVEMNLRLPAMVHGKNGFERLVRACENVLNTSLAWLFCDLAGNPVAGNEQNGPIAVHQPLWRAQKPECAQLEGVHFPSWPLGELRDNSEEAYVVAADVLEWLSLAAQLSPRLQVDDQVDPVFSRYDPLAWSKGADSRSEDASRPENLVRLRWRGLVTNKFVLNVFLAALKASGDSWVALTCHAFNSESLTMLTTDGDCLIWEYKD